MSDWNQQIIEEFRTHAGRVGGPFEGAPLLLLHTTGAQTGEPRLHPMMYMSVGDAFAVFASKAGADSNPAWYHNLLVHPEARVEVGTEVLEIRARELTGTERDGIWATQKERYPGFAGYEATTDRVIPVLLLERR